MCQTKHIVYFIIQKLKNKHTFLEKYTNWAKLSSLILTEREEKNPDILYPWKISPSLPRTSTSDNLQTTQPLTSYQTLRTITNPNSSQLMVEDSPLSPRIPSSDHFDIPQPVSHCNWKCEDLRQPSGWDDNACLSIPSQSNVAVSTKGTGAGFRSRLNVPKPSYTCKSRPLYITNQEVWLVTTETSPNTNMLVRQSNT